MADLRAIWNKPLFAPLGWIVAAAMLAGACFAIVVLWCAGLILSLYEALRYRRKVDWPPWS